MSTTSEANYINSLNKFERRGVHYQRLYAWVDAFKFTMPRLSVSKAIVYFYSRHGVDTFNIDNCVVTYSRLQKEVFPLISNGYFNLDKSENLMSAFEKEAVIKNMLYSWCAATKTIMPQYRIKDAAERFFCRHGVDKPRLSQLAIEDIYNKMRELERKNFIEFGEAE